MNIRLSDHFTYKKLLRFAIPSILMMVFTSIYGVVDGFFVSNFAGKTAFAGINFIMPFILVLGSVGFMMGTGGAALIGLRLGEGEDKQANEDFSMLVYVTIIIGVIFSVIGVVTVRPVAILLGSDESMLDICVEYGRICLLGIPLLMLQYEFQSFMVVAEKPRLGLYFTLAAGCTNIVLDGVLVGVFNLGVIGAALATVTSEGIGSILPILFFLRANDSRLKLGKAKFSMAELAKSMFNGSSEFVSNISMSVVSMLYNAQLMKYSGQNGVAAYGVLMYVNMVFLAVFIGFSVGTAPITSFHYGAGHDDELHSLFTKSVRIIMAFAVLMLIAGEFFSEPLSRIFVGYDDELMALTLRAFRIFSFSFLLASVPIYGSSFFTALNDGLTSAAISFLRTLVFQVGAVLLFPLIFGIDGIWLSIVAAEFVAAAVTSIFWILKRNKYHY